jgi:nitrogen fixation protein FixH
LDQESKKLKPRNHWPKVIVAFFAVVFLVNGIIAIVATTTSDSLIEANPYESGLNYQQTIDSLNEARTRKITAEIKTTKLSRDNYQLAITLSSPTGPYPRDLQAKFIRPNNESSDLILTLSQDSNSPGNYFANDLDLSSGLWLVELEFELDQIIKIKQRLFVE